MSAPISASSISVARLSTAQHTTALTTPQREILTALKIDPPPRVTALTPA